MIVTDEMVEKATRAYGVPSDDDWNYERIRAALEAVAPMLIAQGMREAASDTNHDNWRDWQRAIYARAQELDPK